jgi:AcrR family transcriptional regulator
VSTEATAQSQRSAATRAALIEAAREQFSRAGYANVGTEEIVRGARVTRGALYHHFADKKDLFRAVHEDNEERLVASIAAEVDGIDDPLELLAAGMRAFLDHCEEPALARIGLIEAPAVLGWEEWREIDARYGLGLVTAVLQAGIEAGALAPMPVRTIGHLLLAAMGEAGIMVASAQDPRATRAEVEAALLRLVEGLRA